MPLTPLERGQRREKRAAPHAERERILLREQKLVGVPPQSLETTTDSQINWRGRSSSRKVHSLVHVKEAIFTECGRIQIEVYCI